MSVGKILGRIRKAYNDTPNTVVFYSFAIIIVGSVSGVLVDKFLPFNFWWNILRAFIAIPLSAAFFVIGYIEALVLHNKREEDTPGWVPFRERFSPTWRKRASAIIGAFLIVIAYASSGSVLYTVITSLILASVLWLIAFMRLTGPEKIQEEYDLPDSRDIAFEQRLKQLQKERAKAEEKAKKAKAAKRKKILSLGIIDDDETEEIEIVEE